MILLIILIFFLTKWLIQGAYFEHDLVAITSALENLYANIQRSGQSPLWAPELAGGYPLLAIAQLGFWYPLHMILRQFLPAVWTLNLSMLLHAMLAAIGTFLFLKHNKINRIAAMTGALLLPLGAAFVGKYEMINVVLPFMWIPFIFLFLQLFIESGNLGSFIAWIGTNVLCVLVGHPQMTVYVLFSEGVLVLCLTSLQWHRWLRAIMTLLGIALIVGLTSFYTFPILDNIPLTDRANGIDNGNTQSMFEFEFTPAALSGLFLAHPFGHSNNYHGPKNESELSCYLGPLAIGLAVIGLFLGRRKFPVVWWLALSLTTIGLLLALGEYSPVFKWLVYHGWKYFSCPARFLLYTHIGLVMMSAVGLDYCIAYLKLKQRNINLLIATLLLIGTIAPVLWVSWSWNNGMPWKLTHEPVLAKALQQDKEFIRLFSRQRISDIAPDNDFKITVWNPLCSKCVYKQSFVSPFSTINGIAIKLSSPRLTNGIILISLYTAEGEKIRESTLSVKNIVDSDWSNFIFKPVENVEHKAFYFEITSNTAKQQSPLLLIHTNPGEQYDPSGSLFTCVKKICTEVAVDFKSADSAFKIIIPTAQSIAGYEALTPYVSAGFEINSALWAGSLPILDVSNYLKSLEGGSIWRDARTIINRFPITHVIGLYPPHRYGTNLKGLSLVESVPFGDEFLRLYKNDQAFNRLSFAETIKAISDSVNQDKALSELDPQDQKTVVADIEKNTVFDTSGNKAQIVKDGRTKVVIQTDQDAPGFLVLRDVMLKGWQATIDGHVTTIYHVDGIFRGVFVPTGKHTVVFQYRPEWILPAVYCEVISITIFAGLVILTYTQRKRKEVRQIK